MKDDIKYWQSIRLKAAERIFRAMQEMVPNDPRYIQAEKTMWLSLFYWAVPDLEFTADEFSEAEKVYSPLT